eukprot:TRINITY_DN58990_c0_g1_i1.p1 TRINITY_DN58990_c0_g1~~TRINITY_DN58990_c0_g1_i1.p1  ORF type:complete len:153 (+),score=13.71 TRINITY_DN58990_c0_g1_i1:56-514(+)
MKLPKQVKDWEAKLQQWKKDVGSLPGGDLLGDEAYNRLGRVLIAILLAVMLLMGVGESLHSRTIVHMDHMVQSCASVRGVMVIIPTRFIGAFVQNVAALTMTAVSNTLPAPARPYFAILMHMGNDLIWLIRAPINYCAIILNLCWPPYWFGW